MHERQAAAPGYGHAMAQLEAVRADLAEPIRAYVTALYGEAAMFRVKANRLRAQSSLESHVRERLKGGQVSAAELGSLVVDFLRSRA